MCNFHCLPDILLYKFIYILFCWFSTMFNGFLLVFNGFRCVFHNCYWCSMICYWFFSCSHRNSIDVHWISVAFHWAGCCSRLLSQAPAGCRLLQAASCSQAADFRCIFHYFHWCLMIFIDFRCIFNDFGGAGGSYSGDHTMGGGWRAQRAAILYIYIYTYIHICIYLHVTLRWK